MHGDRDRIGKQAVNRLTGILPVPNQHRGDWQIVAERVRCARAAKVIAEFRSQLGCPEVLYLF